MKIIALLLSVGLSVLGLLAFTPLAPSPKLGQFAILSFGVMAAGFAGVLIGTLLKLMGKHGNYLRVLVGISCVLIPVVWVGGCLAQETISGVELLIGLALVLVVVFQWWVFESSGTRNEP